MMKRVVEEEKYEGPDRLSELPESILCSHILTHLPITDAVRSSLLSPKWRYLWTKIPHLHFSPHFFFHLRYDRNYIENTHWFCYLRYDRNYEIENIMEHIFAQHQAPLESFQFHLTLEDVKAMDINQCIHYAAIKGVKRMVIRDDTYFPKKKMHLPFSFFACTALVELKLDYLIFPKIPSCSENLLFLKSCCLCYIDNLTDHRLQRFLDLCPNLQKLEGISCEDLIHLKIQASNLNYLMLLCCPRVESLTADCPQLIELRTWCRNSNLAKLYLNSYSLVELNSTSRIMDIRSFKMEMEMVSDFAFPNLKNAYLCISCENELGVLSFLLKNAPSLITLTLNLTDEKKCMDQLLDLKRAYAEVEIKILTDVRREEYLRYDDDDLILYETYSCKQSGGQLL